MSQPNRTIYNNLIYGTAIVLSALVVVGILLLRDGYKQGFPVLPSGIFVGSYSIHDKTVPLFVITDAPKKNLTFFSDHDQTQPEKIVLDQSFSHITVSINGEGFRLLGGKNNDPIFEGELIRLADGTVGTWQLSKSLTLDEVKITEPSEEEMSTVKDARDLLYIDSWIASNSGKISEQKIRIDELQSKVFDGPSYKQHAKERLVDAETALEYARERLKVKQEEFDALQEKLNVAVKVSKRGRLVSLSRESLERERRWIDSVLRMESPETTSPEVEQKYQKALEVKNIEDRIRIEEAEIARLQGKEGSTGNREEGEFYGNLE